MHDSPLVVADNDRALLLALIESFKLVQVLPALDFDFDTNGGRADMVKRSRDVVIDIEALPLVSVPSGVRLSS